MLGAASPCATINADALTAANNGDPIKVKHDTDIVSKVGDVVVKVFRGGEVTRSERPFSGTELGAKYGARFHEKAMKGETKTHGIS